MRKFFPKTFWGFPVNSDNQIGLDGATKQSQSSIVRRRSEHRGVALLIAIMAVAIVMVFATNVIISSSVNLSLAVAHRDDVKAEYMAKSAFNMAILLVMADLGIDLFQYQVNKQKPPTDSGDDLWSKMNGFPVGGDTAELIATVQKGFDVSSINDEGVVNVLKLFDGNFVVNVEDESSRINISRCIEGRCAEVTTMLEGLFSCPAEKAFLDRKSLVPRQLANRIKDWVDQNTTPEDNGLGDEDSAYLKKTPPYTSKNSPMDSINELRLIEGWDDEVHAVFSPFITIYPYVEPGGDARPVNINTVKKELLACLIPTAKTDCADKFYAKLLDLQENGGVVAQDSRGIEQFLSGQLCDAKSSSDDDKKKWFSARSDTYRFNIEGNVGTQSRKLTAVIARGVPDIEKKKTDSYQILYWKMD